MTIIMRHIAPVGLTLLAIALAACNRDANRPSTTTLPKQGSLIGKWSEPTTHETLEFQQDGSFIGSLASYGSQTPQSVSGKYLLTGEQLIINLNGGDAMTCQAQLSGDDLVVVYTLGGQLKRDGTFSKFHRTS